MGQGCAAVVTAGLSAAHQSRRLIGLQVQRHGRENVAAKRVVPLRVRVAVATNFASAPAAALNKRRLAIEEVVHTEAEFITFSNSRARRQVNEALSLELARVGSWHIVIRDWLQLHRASVAPVHRYGDIATGSPGQPRLMLPSWLRNAAIPTVKAGAVERLGKTAGL